MTAWRGGPVTTSGSWRRSPSSDGRSSPTPSSTKNLYSEDTESMGLFGAVISKMEVRKMQRRMRRSHRARAESGHPGRRCSPVRLAARPGDPGSGGGTAGPPGPARDFIAVTVSCTPSPEEWQEEQPQDTPGGNKWQSADP